MPNINVKSFSKPKVNIDEPVTQPEHEPQHEPQQPTRIIKDNKFLQDLHKDNYINQIKEEEQKIENDKNYEKIRKNKLNKIRNTIKKI